MKKRRIAAKKISKGKIMIPRNISLLFIVSIAVGISSVYFVHTLDSIRPGVLADATGGSIIATDTFQRANQSLWGTASDGQSWGAAVNSSNQFSITNDTGQEYNAEGNTFLGTLGPQVTDAEVLLTVRSTSFANNTTGAIIRESDSNNYYFTTIDGENLLLKKKVNGTLSNLSLISGTTSFPASINTRYTIRFQVNGNTLSVKAWPANSVEPGSWSAVATDNSIPGAGFVGIRTNEQLGTTIAYTYFQATQLTNIVITPTPTPIQRYTCDGNTGQCIPIAQGYYTTSNCNNSCWGSVTQNPTPTPTPTSVPIVPTSTPTPTQVFIPTPTSIYIYPTNSVTPTNYPLPTDGLFGNLTVTPTMSTENQNSSVPDTSGQAQASGPLQGVVQFFKSIPNPFHNNSSSVPISTSDANLSAGDKLKLLYQEMRYNPSSQDFNYAQSNTPQRKKVTFISIIFTINNAIRNFFGTLFQSGINNLTKHEH